jgi:hypothetical protein
MPFVVDIGNASLDSRPTPLARESDAMWWVEGVAGLAEAQARGAEWFATFDVSSLFSESGGASDPSRSEDAIVRHLVGFINTVFRPLAKTVHDGVSCPKVKPFPKAFKKWITSPAVRLSRSSTGGSSNQSAATASSGGSSPTGGDIDALTVFGGGVSVAFEWKKFGQLSTKAGWRTYMWQLLAQLDGICGVVDGSVAYGVLMDMSSIVFVRVCRAGTAVQPLLRVLDCVAQLIRDAAEAKTAAGLAWVFVHQALANVGSSSVGSGSGVVPVPGGVATAEYAMPSASVAPSAAPQAPLSPSAGASAPPAGAMKNATTPLASCFQNWDALSRPAGWSGGSLDSTASRSGCSAVVDLGALFPHWRAASVRDLDEYLAGVYSGELVVLRALRTCQVDVSSFMFVIVISVLRCWLRLSQAPMMSGTLLGGTMSWRKGCRGPVVLPPPSPNENEGGL